MREVTVGGAPRSVPPVNGFKTDRILKVIGRVSERIPELMRLEQQERARLQAEAGTLPITREMAKLEQFESYGLTDEDFDRVGGDVINVPAAPSGNSVLLALIPHVVRLASSEAQEILAILLADNGALFEADLDVNGDVDDVLRRERITLMHTIGSPRELVRILTELVQVIGEEVPKEEELDALVQAVSQATGGLLETQESESTGTSPTQDSTPSIDSPGPTEELETQPSFSTEPVDETSTVSSPA